MLSRSHVRFASTTPHFLAPCSLPPKKVNFNDDTIFQGKSVWWLLRALLVLRMCRIQYLSKNSVTLMRRAESVFGPFLAYNIVVKATVFGHFCAGENEREVKDTVKALEKQGIGSVLDYAAEADAETVGDISAPCMAAPLDLSVAKLVHNTTVAYLPHERLHDENMKLNMMCVLHASLNASVGGVGLVAVKVTAMCDPQLLARVSAIIFSVNQSWVRFFNEEATPSLEECRIAVGRNTENQRYLTHDQLRKGLASYGGGRKYTDTEINAIIKQLDENNVGKVDYYKFKRLVISAILALNPTPSQVLIRDMLPTLTEEERELWCALYKCVSVVVHTAKELNVRVFIDAEQTFYQPAIDYIALEFQRKYNIDKPTVYNTYQCYLTYTEDRVFNDLTRAELEGWIWGGKMVRGAYMVQEREAAVKYKYTSPVWPTYEETNKCYQVCAKRVLDEFTRLPDKPYGVLFGTHNRESLGEISDYLLGLAPTKGSVVFAQLYGMADNLTIPLRNAGFDVFKYVPYGPVKETIHYLGRRAIENSSLLTTGGTEVGLMKRELRRRFFWFMK